MYIIASGRDAFVDSINVASFGKWMMNNTLIWDFDFFEYGKLGTSYGMSDFTTLAATKPMLGYNKQYNLLSYTRLLDRGTFFQTRGSYSVIVTHLVDIQEYILIELQRKDDPFGRAYTQIRFTRLEGQGILSKFKQGYALYSSLLAVYSAFTLKNYPEAILLDQLAVTIYPALQSTNEIIGNLLWNTLPNNSIFPLLIALKVAKHILQQGTSVFVIDRIPLSLREKTLICEAIQFLLSVSNKILTFSFHNISLSDLSLIFSSPDDEHLRFIPPSQFYRIDTEDLQKDEDDEQLLTIHTELSQSSSSWNEAHQKWEYVASLLEKKFSLQDVIDLVTGKTTTKSNSVDAFKSKSLSPQVFISYSRRDLPAMQHISKSLQAANINVWTDEQLEPGTPLWEETVAKAIENAVCVVVLLSPDAKGSIWVGRELSYAEEHKKTIIPLVIRGDGRNAIPFRVISTQRIDGTENMDNAIKTLIQTLQDLTNLESKDTKVDES